MKGGKEQPGTTTPRSPVTPAEPEQRSQGRRKPVLPADELARFKPALKTALQPVLAAAKAETGRRGWLEFKYIQGRGPYVYHCCEEDGWRCSTYLGRIDRNGQFVAVRTRNRGAAGAEAR